MEAPYLEDACFHATSHSDASYWRAAPGHKPTVSHFDGVANQLPVSSPRFPFPPFFVLASRCSCAQTLAVNKPSLLPSPLRRLGLSLAPSAKFHGMTLMIAVVAEAVTNNSGTPRATARNDTAACMEEKASPEFEVHHDSCAAAPV